MSKKRALEMTDSRIEKARIGSPCSLIDNHEILQPTKIFYQRTGFYLEITKTNKKMFRFVYRIKGKQQKMTIGRFSIDGDGINNFSLKQAYQVYLNAVDKLKMSNIDPKTDREEEQQRRENEEKRNKQTFGIVVAGWLENSHLTTKSGKPLTDSHKTKLRQRLDKYCKVALYDKPIHSIAESQLREVLAIPKQDAARRLYISLRQIFQYARMKSYIDSNPTELILSREFAAVKNSRFKHTLELSILQKILRLIYSNNVGEEQTQTALKLAPLLFVRPTELRLMRWSDIDFDHRLWHTHKSKVIGQEVTSTEVQESEPDLIVPLSKYAVELIEKLRLISHSDYVFAVRGDEGAPSDSTFSKALRVLLEKNGLKGKQTVHGFRHVVRSLAPAKLDIPIRVLEQQMSHAEAAKSSDNNFYDQYLYLPERRAFMDVWSSFILAVRDTYRTYTEAEIEIMGKTDWTMAIDMLKSEYKHLKSVYEQAE
jgi:integrase